MDKRTTILMEIEKDLEQFDRILLITNECTSLFPAVTDAINILVLSISALPVESDSHITYRQITKEQQTELLQTYHMYEFSDRFRIVSRDDQFGSIWNYVDAGVLTEQEALEALVR